MAVKWLSKAECDFCRENGVSDPTIKGKKLYDAPTTYGCWATMCRNCYNTYGKKNSGGQEYTKNENGEWIKTKDLVPKTKTKNLFDVFDNCESEEEMYALLGL